VPARVGWVEERNPAFYNPVKPGDVNPVSNWKYLSFHRWVDQGVDPMDWATYDYKVIDMGFLARYQARLGNDCFRSSASIPLV
jgi:hypothetical protein